MNEKKKQNEDLCLMWTTYLVERIKTTSKKSEAISLNKHDTVVQNAKMQIFRHY